MTEVHFPKFGLLPVQIPIFAPTSVPMVKGQNTYLGRTPDTVVGVADIIIKWFIALRVFKR